MKKIVVLLLACAMLMGLCAVPAAAADTTVEVAYLDENEEPITSASAGDMILVVISVYDLPAASSFAFDFRFDDSLYTVLADESGWDFGALPRATRNAIVMQDFDVAGKKAAAALKDKTYAGDMEDCFCLALEAKTDLTKLETPLIFIAKNANDEVARVQYPDASSEPVTIFGRTVIFNETFQARYVVKAEDLAGKTATFKINDNDVTAETITIDGVDYVAALSPAVKPGAINTAMKVELFVDGELSDTYNDTIEAALDQAAGGESDVLKTAAIATIALANQAAQLKGGTGATYTVDGAITDVAADPYKITPHGNGVEGTVKIVGTSLYLKEGIFLNFYVDPQGATYDESMKLSYNGVEYAREKENGGYWLYSVPVELADATTAYGATMVGVDSNTYTNSVAAYAADLMETDAALGQAILNYAVYGQAAIKG